MSIVLCLRMLQPREFVQKKENNFREFMAVLSPEALHTLGYKSVKIKEVCKSSTLHFGTKNLM